MGSEKIEPLHTSVASATSAFQFHPFKFAWRVESTKLEKEYIFRVFRDAGLLNETRKRYILIMLLFNRKNSIPSITLLGKSKQIVRFFIDTGCRALATV